jgi:hypothetical protein
MRNPIQPLQQNSTTLPRAFTTLTALCLMLCAQLAAGASIAGSATDADGEPLSKVSICLTQAGSSGKCDKVRWTDRNGDYAFKGLKSGFDYIVTVNGDSSAANRKFEQHANYAWLPRKHTVTINSKNEKHTVAGFVGKFNFSNFQRIVSLTGADFPELSSLDLVGSYVGLKVFISSGNVDEPPKTIFLGQVKDANNLKISASVPLASSYIEYEIFSDNLALSGSIALVQP